MSQCLTETEFIKFRLAALPTYVIQVAAVFEKTCASNNSKNVKSDSFGFQKKLKIKTF